VEAYFSALFLVFFSWCYSAPYVHSLILHSHFFFHGFASCYIIIIIIITVLLFLLSFVTDPLVLLSD